MPIYEYECEACGGHEEHIQSFSATPLSTCGKCGKDTLHRVISASAFHLKGGGWYKDGYGSSSGKSGGSTSGESKPAAKAKKDSE
jgi:putative FmdB family regulatory protein